MDAAYERLKHERKINKWNLQTVSAISDGIVLATTKNKRCELIKKKAGVK